MRKIFIVAVLVLSYLSGISQDVQKLKKSNSLARTVQIYYVLKDNPDVKHGEFLYKYKGKVQIQGQFENNMQVGEWTYFPERDLKIVGQYQNGKKQGEWKYYREDKLISVLNYTDGELNGKCTGYYQNGEIASELIYKNGKRNGQKTSYFNDGTLKEMIDYSNGIINGKHVKNTKEGELLYEIEYEDGVPFNLNINEMYQDSIMLGGNLKNGTGEFIRYLKVDSEKQEFSVYNYSQGKLHGQVRLYDRKGELKIRGQYQDGFMVGMWEFIVNNTEYAKAFRKEDKLTSIPDLVKYQDYQEAVYHTSEIMPKFADGSARNFQQHIVQTLQYPKEAAQKGIEGKVLIRFKVNQFGLVNSLEVLEGQDELLIEEAIRVVSSSPLWSPGFSDQIPVEVSFVFPIVFQL